MTGARARAGLTRRLRQVTAHGDRGSSTAEAALVTPLLVALMLFVVLCGRLVSAQMDLDAAASAAARAASLARTDAAARAAADRTARETLAARSVTCQQITVSVITGGLRPGGAVTVTLACAVPLSDLALLAVPGFRVVRASSTSPIDVFRGGPS
ncbi:TadE/TadG family type IV pilus assembly protein [Micromonospora sp. NPDC005324]|uniref:TadE/TadG family type IV pilus assembly protein n=1 Tax=Micromonospora sp. NPDC005324 TaxID=3157033 RepID=UPI00339DFE9F